MQRARLLVTQASPAIRTASLFLQIDSACTTAAFSRLLHSSQFLHASPAGEASDSGSTTPAPKPSTSTAQSTPNLKEINRSIRLNTKLQVHGDISYAEGIVAEMKRRQDHYLELLAAKARLRMKKAQAEAPLTTSLLAAMQAQAQQYDAAAKLQPGAGQKQE